MSAAASGPMPSSALAAPGHCDIMATRGDVLPTGTKSEGRNASGLISAAAAHEANIRVSGAHEANIRISGMLLVRVVKAIRASSRYRYERC